MGGSLPLALLFIVLGAVFDFFDGFTARLLGVSSPIGKELDSLADVVTFGVAPASMAFTLLGNISCSAGGRCPMAPYFPYAAFLIAAFSALRLAKIQSRYATEPLFYRTPHTGQRPLLGFALRFTHLYAELARAVSGAFGAAPAHPPLVLDHGERSSHVCAQIQALWLAWQRHSLLVRAAFCRCGRRFCAAQRHLACPAVIVVLYVLASLLTQHKSTEENEA